MQGTFAGSLVNTREVLVNTTMQLCKASPNCLSRASTRLTTVSLVTRVLVQIFFGALLG